MTILCNKFDGHPKGFAYVEFSDKDSVSTAMALDDSLFRGRQIKVCGSVHLTQGAVILSGVDIWKYIFQVMPKRTNKPGLCITNRPPRGRGFRGRGRGASMRGFGAMRRPRYVDGREKSLIISPSGRSSM